jgi:WD40 repeat protein
VPYCGSNLPAIAGTSDFQDALAGLQQLQLLTAAFGFGGSYGPGGNVLINQVPSVTPDLLTAAFASIDGAIALPAPVPVNQFATSNLPAMVTAREYHTATLLANGKVLIAGGEDNSVNILNTAELYDPAANAFTAVSSTMSFARESATATLLPNGKVLIAGGLGEGGDVSAAEIYDPVANSFSVGPTMVYPRDSASAILLPNGKVLIAGGDDNTGHPTTTEIYDPVANSFTVGPAMNTAREETPNAILLPNGKVLIAGGWVFGSGGSGVLASTELYDPVSNRFAAPASTASMSSPREYSTATLLPNGKVLIAGGDDGDDNLSASDLYTP